jgi:outer membrane receptor protein involved in Fe transport
VEELPGTHEDMARSLQQLPGSAAGDYSARTNVRGSRDDETVFRFDGVTLIDPFHLKNFQALFSAIDPAVTEAVDIYTGDFPIEFGGSIGAVADITPRQPTRLIAEAGVSVLNDSILFGMPFAGDRASVLINARASNLSRMARLLDRNVGEPDFRDLTMRLTWSPRSARRKSTWAANSTTATSMRGRAASTAWRRTCAARPCCRRQAWMQIARRRWTGPPSIAAACPRSATPRCSRCGRNCAARRAAESVVAPASNTRMPRAARRSTELPASARRSSPASSRCKR